MPTTEQIAAQQELFLSYLPLVRREFGQWPGVQLIGLGAKERNGEITDEWAFRFYIRKKLPSSQVPANELIPSEIFGVQTDIIPGFETEELICDSADRINDVDANGEYVDGGILGGAPIRNEYFGNDHATGYGTLGILARRVTDSKLVGLTCAHVVNAAADTMTTGGTKIGLPQYWVSCCCCPKGKIGIVPDIAPNAVYSADLDCAIIEIDNDVRDKVAAATGENKILGHHGLTPSLEIQTISGARAIMCFENVTKRGQGTGLTHGKVVDLAFGTNQMLIENIDATKPFACHGDSGAVIVSSNNMVLGLVVAASMGNFSTAATRNQRRTIATHIKPVMQALGISIAGVQFGTLTEPVDGGPDGCEIKAWPGGQTETAMNPGEVFDITMFEPTATSGDWNVAIGAAGAIIIEKDHVAITPTTSVTSAGSIKVRYDTVSTSIDVTNAVQIQATISGNPRIKFRTIFKITPRVPNVSAALDTDNTKRFLASGGSNSTCGVDFPATAGITRYLAKAEIGYDILPAGIDWSSSGGITFITGNPAGIKGNILSKRDTKFCRGEQATGAPNRIHTDQIPWVSAGDSSADDFQGAGATGTARNKIFRLGNKGFLPLIESSDINHDSYNPTNFLQRYVRSHYRDFIHFHDGTSFVQITPFVEWSVNLTAIRNAGGTAPPTPGAATANIVEAGLNADPLPNTQPVIAPIATQEVDIGEAPNVTLTAVPTDADRDILTDVPNPPPPPPNHAAVHWTQTSPAPIAALTVNPANPNNSVRFTTPLINQQLIFSAITNDRTAGLSRAPAVPVAPAVPNFQSVPVSTTVNVVEWLHREGGFPAVADNDTEVFTSAQFGMTGNVNWNVAVAGATAAVIIVPAAGGTTANNIDTITVRYDTASADMTRAHTVIIQATNPAGRVFFKRRTVMAIEWLQRCGERPNPADNGAELFNSSEFGFPAGTVVNWDVSTGVPDGFITETAGTTANGMASIHVRYDHHSPDATKANTVIIKATDPANPLLFNYKRRSVARVTLSLRDAPGTTIEPAPEFEDYVSSNAAGEGDALGVRPMGTGRADYHNVAYTHCTLVIADVVGHLPSTVFRWQRMLDVRSWYIKQNAGGTQWDVTQRWSLLAYDDTAGAAFNDATPSIANNRMYIYDNSASVLSDAHRPGTNATPIGGFIYDERAFVLRIQRQDGASWITCAEMPLGQRIIARRDATTGTVSADWAGIENSYANVVLSATVTEAEVRAIVGPGLPIVIDPTANN